MRTFIHNDVQVLATQAADAIQEVLSSVEHPVLGLATGSSPLAIYQELITRHKNGLSFGAASAFTLDEYVGLPKGHPETYAQVIRNEFTAHVDIDDARVFSPDAFGTDVEGAPARYEDAIVGAGGIDIQILGIGSNGHIEFNEPGAARDSLTRIEELALRTRQDNARFFDSIEDVPTHAITQGLGTIARARQLVLIATGEGKADAVAALARGEFDPQWPATAVAQHPNLLVLLDEAAASRISG